MNIILFIILVIGISFVATDFIKSQVNCPPPKIIYRYIPKHLLDVQFGEDNNPSDIYADMFIKSNPWIGGYTIGDKKTTMNELIETKVKK